VREGRETEPAVETLVGAVLLADDGELVIEAVDGPPNFQRHDAAADQLLAGLALERVLLTATREGLTASFLNQPLEYDDLRRTVQRTTRSPREVVLIRPSAQALSLLGSLGATRHRGHRPRSADRRADPSTDDRPTSSPKHSRPGPDPRPLLPTSPDGTTQQRHKTGRTSTTTDACVARPSGAPRRARPQPVQHLC
jgi:hypothetical protein